MDKKLKNQKQAFIIAIEEGLADIEEGRSVNLRDAKRRLVLNATLISSNNNL